MLPPPNYLQGCVPREPTTEELFEACHDDVTADMLVDNDKKTMI